MLINIFFYFYSVSYFIFNVNKFLTFLFHRIKCCYILQQNIYIYLYMDKVLLNVLLGGKSNYSPTWLMRQAGRYLPEYKKTRSKAGSFLDLCFTPKLATEVTLQPLRRFELDGAILFADILLIPKSLCQNLDFREGVGPLLTPLKNKEDLKQLKNINQIHNVLNPVYDAVSKIKAKLDKKITFIGFAGSPWTVSTYMIEGKGSKDHHITKSFMLEFPDIYDHLISIIEEATIEYLSNQIIAGVDVVKLFDSWAGSLPNSYIEKYSLIPMKKIAMELKNRFPKIPIIVFPRGVGPMYEEFSKVNVFDCIAIDSSIDLKWAKEKIQKNNVVQGNLDPAFLVAGGKNLKIKTKEILKNLSSSGHIFNLGHGITPDAKIENVELLLKTIKEK